MSANFGGSAPGGLANGGTHGRGPSVKGLNRVDIPMSKPSCGGEGNAWFIRMNERKFYEEVGKEIQKKK